MSAVDRLQTAQAVTSGQDAKASSLLSAAGILLTAGSLATTLGHPGPWAMGFARTAGLFALVAVLILLGTLRPRGGSPKDWLQEDQKPSDELKKVAKLAGRKHEHLRLAIAFLYCSVALAGVAVILT